MSIVPASVDISDREFEAISDLVKSLCGINLHEGKRELVRARLAKRLRALNMASFDDYLRYVREGREEETVEMLDVLSTNLTSFFRENDHFEYLSDQVLPAAAQRGRLRVWSAGCSTGEEPYSIAIQVAEALPHLRAPARCDVRVLATDLSTHVLRRAQAGEYPEARLRGLSQAVLARYFTPLRSEDEPRFRVREEVRSVISFARLNLMDPWPMHGPFDVIFCRNVMIYFDKPTQQELITRFAQLLSPGGTLFIGHSESLTGIRHGFRYVRPTIYEKQ